MNKIEISVLRYQTTPVITFLIALRKGPLEVFLLVQFVLKQVRNQHFQNFLQ